MKNNRILTVLTVFMSVGMIIIFPVKAQSPEIPSDKLSNPEKITAGFQDGQSMVKVIVNLIAPTKKMTNADWNRPAALQELHDQVLDRQLEVISTLSADEFMLRRRFENQAAFSAELTIQGLEKLSKNPLVKSIEPVEELELHLAQGVPLMNASLHRSTYNGKGVAIAIVDSGIDYTHPMLGGGGFPNTKVIGGFDTGANDADPIPQGEPHGTSTAGLAAGNLGFVGDYIGGIAHNAKLYAMKVEDNAGFVFEDYIVDAWDWCVSHKNDDPCNPILVISNSLGSGRYFTNCDGSKTALATAADNATAAGITVLVSSGNDGYCDSISSPACLSNAISVGAVYDAAFGTYLPCISSDSCADKSASGGCSTNWFATDNTAADMVTSYSNTGSILDVLAPSNQAYTTDIVGAGGYSSGDYYSSFGGTSAACPYAAGVAACIQQAAKEITGSFLTPDEIRNVLINTGDPVTDTKVAITKSRINMGNAISTFSGKPNAVSDTVSTASVTSVTITLSATDNGLPDPPGALSYIITTLPSHGSLSDPNTGLIGSVPHTLAGLGNQVSYTPFSCFSGTDSFQFKANDGEVPPTAGDSDPATVSIEVNDIIYLANMDTDPGWTLDPGKNKSKWQWGTPTSGGGQYGNPDPSNGFTGSTIIGYNLEGDYRNRINPTEWATTPAIDCSQHQNVKLSFYRLLNVEDSTYDHAYVEVSSDGINFTTVWENTATLTDSQWTLQTYDISAVADGQSTVFLRWGMGTSDTRIQFSGWNIDDVVINGELVNLTSDINCDGRNDYLDFSILSVRWLDTGCNFPDWCGKTDINSNTSVGFEDLLQIVNNWLGF